jgi:glycosyltransferase involved in cell wall biosynthesis
MKILILSPKMPWPPKDGGAIATLNLALGIARNGTEVTILAANTGKHYFPADQVPAGIRDLVRIHPVNVDTRVRPLRLLTNYLFSSYPYIAERFISTEYRIKLLHCQEENGYDIVQLEGPYMGYYRRFIKKGTRISLRAHNLEHRIWELRAKEEKNPLKRAYFLNLSNRIRNLEQKLLQEIDMLVPITASDGEGFSRLSHNLPEMVCPAGLDLDNYIPEQILETTGTDRPDSRSSGPGPTGIRLFYIGALDWAPNQEGLDWFFDRVWPGIRSRWPDLELHVAGRNPGHYFTSVPPANVWNEGEVEDALSFFRRHTVMIVPLLSGSGIRIKILEAMAMGKVVVSSALGAAGIGASHGKHLFIAETAEDYLEILEKLQNRPALIRETGERARQFVKENFDNLVLSGKLISFYKAQLA